MPTRISKNFLREEFACRCCGASPIDSRIVDAAQKMRDILGHELHCVSGAGDAGSGYRCTRHNAMVGGADGSYHTLGRASDLWHDGPFDELVAAATAMASTLTYIYVLPYPEKNFVHIDMRYWK